MKNHQIEDHGGEYGVLSDRAAAPSLNSLEVAKSGELRALQWLARVRNWLERAEARVGAGFRVPPNGG